MIAACLPPREVSRPKVTPEHLFELFQKWTPDQATRRCILVTNPPISLGPRTES
jgi:hypothetical protein